MILAISEIEPFADLKAIDMDIEVETRLVGMAQKPVPTGREILVIRIPYERSASFLKRQVKLVEDELEQVLKLIGKLEDDKRGLLSELDTLSKE